MSALSVTLKDIAARVGLSPAVISRVLNGKPGVWISDENRRRIHDAARELGYRPRAAARSLRSGKTNSVVMAICWPREPAHDYGPDLVRIAVGLAAEGYHLQVRVTPSPDALASTLEELDGSGVCDVFAVWGRESELDAIAPALEALTTPFAASGRHERCHPHWLQVDFDHEDMMARAVADLVVRGHTRIAYFGLGAEEPFARCLRKGFEEAVRSRGLTISAEWVSERGDTARNTEAQIDEWFAAPLDGRPTAIVSGASGLTWMAAERALLRLGIRLGDGPDKVAIVGQGCTDKPLWRGRGRGFEGMDRGAMGEAMARDLLLPLLRGEHVKERIVRLRPALVDGPPAWMDEEWRPAGHDRGPVWAPDNGRAKRCMET